MRHSTIKRHSRSDANQPRFSVVAPGAVRAHTTRAGWVSNFGGKQLCYKSGYNQLYHSSCILSSLEKQNKTTTTCFSVISFERLWNIFFFFFKWGWGRWGFFLDFVHFLAEAKAGGFILQYSQESSGTTHAARTGWWENRVCRQSRRRCQAGLELCRPAALLTPAKGQGQGHAPHIIPPQPLSCFH